MLATAAAVMAAAARGVARVEGAMEVAATEVAARGTATVEGATEVAGSAEGATEVAGSAAGSAAAVTEAAARGAVVTVVAVRARVGGARGAAVTEVAQRHSSHSCQSSRQDSRYRPYRRTQSTRRGGTPCQTISGRSTCVA